jgi:hypothetical protein
VRGWVLPYFRGMPIAPDTKNWTWVLERPCPECGFDASTVGHDDVAPMIRANARTWERVLAAAGVEVRPNEEMWSPLEYGCHVRDVYRIMTTRLDLVLTESDPMFPNWDQDATAVDDAYDTQDPTRVAVELAAAAEPFAARFDAVGVEQWTRPGRRSDGARFTVESLARYALHDVIHHLVDVPDPR